MVANYLESPHMQNMFPSLPVDCWIAITDFLKPGDIVSVSAVCRDLHLSLRPLIYNRVSWEWETVPVERILQLLRTVLQNPKLALLIHHITIMSPPRNAILHDWNEANVKPNSTKDATVGFEEVVGLAQALVEKVEFPDASKWNEALGNGNAYAFIAILLSQLHSLRSLRLDYSFVWKLGFPGLMMKHALFSAPEGLLSRFTHLNIVDYGSNVPIAEEFDGLYNDFDTTAGYPLCDPDQFMAWFYLPAIQSLSIWLRSFKDVIADYNSQQANLSQLQTLVLARTTITDDEVQDLLSQMASLKMLHLGLAYRWHDEVILEVPDFIIEGLEYVSQTVETLSLGLEYYPYNEGYYSFDCQDEYSREQFQGFLQKFPRLRSAEVPITLLAGINTDNIVNVGSFLPPTLEELCLHWDCEEVLRGLSESEFYDCVWRLLDDLHPHSPNLKRIIIRQMVCSPAARANRMKEHAKLQVAYAQAGIELQAVFDYLSPGLWTQEGYM
ncbi:hypothetical protein BDV27DRAFT_37325 [Aspergillus caelatus]|uniref:F-box domain-containing protein n=1 Tax=Aspergillus caelatus TaxID=61420 RepID=A0A5N6ZSX3_9EURO|nr:uncharacterized protein BDV27DRAFT_37325 [Aspergillus caelatus]KAE8360701.1 hypothetical protein BDV27DRAFT_37325 [Aspergillus caelatus]